MSVETLRNIEKIGGYEVRHIESELPQFVQELIERAPDPEPPWIMVDHKIGIVGFKMQNGAIGENGLNGCQFDTLIETAKIILSKLNEALPCRENALAITKLDEALHWIDARKRDREKRGVEGSEKA